MTKVIWIFVIALALWGAYGLFNYWQSFQNQQETERKAAATKVVVGAQLPGLPGELEQSLINAQQDGPKVFGNWLSQNARAIQDPRLAWIELDYCAMIYRDNPAEAKKIFAAVKNRTPVTSPVWPRISELQKSYE
jgi:hypothetical protein